MAGVYSFYGAGASEELDCIPSSGGGTWLSRALIESRMKDGAIVRWECPKGFELQPEHIRKADCQDWIEKNLRPELEKLDPALPSGWGNDFARNGDLSSTPVWQVTKELKRRFPFIIELRNVPFQQQTQIMFYMGDRLPRLRKAAMDARGNGQYLAEVCMQRYGAQVVEQIMLSEGWYRDHTGPFKAAFEDDTIEIPRDEATLEDLRAFEMVRGVPRIPDKRSTDADGKKRHGDSGIALLLGHYASRQEGAPIEYDSIGQRETTGDLADYMS
jgi:phage FluMu gp28-like protein